MTNGTNSAPTLESLAEEISFIRAALEELLRRVGEPVAAAPAPPPSPPPSVYAPPGGGDAGFRLEITKNGRSLPAPYPLEGIASYAMRVADFVGGERGAQARRGAGSLFGGMGTALVNKHGGSWLNAIEEFVFGDPSYVPDPAWGSYRPGAPR